MNIEITRLEQSRTAYHFMVLLCSVLKDIDYNPNEKNIEQLKLIIKGINVGMPLPSGRYGNSLAVALEMQYYQGALIIINNAKELDIDLKAVSSEFGGKNVWDAKKTFELSLLGFDEEKINEEDEFYQKFPWLKDIKNANINAKEEIALLLKKQPKK